MHKPSIATAQKIPTTQLTKSSAWAKGPPPNTSSGAPTPRSQSPAPTTPTSANHSRRPSGLGQGVPIKDGVSVPRNNMGAVKQGSAVSFGSIDDAPAPISSSPASTPAVKSDGVKSFGTVPANAGHVNGKPSISSAPKPTSNATTNGSSTSAAPSSSMAPASAPSKVKVDVYKLFQSSPAPSQPSSDVASPSTRPASLPQQQHHTPQQPSQGQQPPPPQPSQPGAHAYPFVPPRGIPPQHPNSASGRGPPGSPIFRQQIVNGAGSRPPQPGGPSGPGGPQMPAGLSSPRLGHAHAQPSAIPPQQQMSWQPHYYQDPYMQQSYYSGWYMPPPTPPISHSHHPHQHPHPPGPPGQPHAAMSPRNPTMPLQGPGTPTLAHAVPSHPPHPTPPSHSTAPSLSGLSSPPPTPSASSHGNLPSSAPPSARLNTNANAFVPGGRSSKIVIKSVDGTEVDLNSLKKGPGPPGPPVGASNANGSSAANRKSIRLETEDAKKKRLAEEEAKEQAKKDVEEKEKREKLEAEEKARKEEEERIAATKKQEEEEKERQRQEEEERIRKEEEEKERIRKDAEEKERLRQEEEERLKKEEEERLQKEEAERLRKAEEEKQKALEEAERLKAEGEAKAAAEAASKGKEDGEVAEVQPADVKEKPKDKEFLRIDTSAASPVSVDQSRRRPGPLDLSHASRREPITPSLPSALATARIIEDINQVPYPEGIKSPNVELNTNAKDGKFRYDREFLLQFMSICKEKPDMLPPLDAIGLEPSDIPHYTMSRGGSGRGGRTATNPIPGVRTASTGLGIGNFKPGAPNPFSMGNFATPGSGGAGSKTSEERFAVANRAVSVGGQAGLPFGGRPVAMVRSPSQGGSGGHPMGSNRTRSKRGEKRNEGNKVPSHQQSHGSGFNQTQIGPGGIPLEPVAPLEMSANRWTAGSTSRKPQAVDPDSPEIVDRKVKALLNKLTMEKFDSISDQIIAWANKSEKEKDGRTLIQVIRLVFEKATDEAAWSEMYARLCRKMMEQISSKVQDDGIKNNEGKPIAGGQLFRKYLLNRCQEDFERGWDAKDAAAAAAVAKASEDEAAKAANDKSGDDGEPVLYSEEYYAAQKAKRRGLGLIKFIGELFKLQMLTERIMHECIKKLLGNVENPEEEEIESLCKLLTTVGKSLDTSKARAHMDVYFSRMKELTRSGNVSSRMQFMLQDIIELRDRQWVTRNLVAAPSTIAQVHEVAAKDRAAAEKESFQRQMSMSRGGSRRGGERGQFDQQVGPDGWAVAGGGGPPRPPSKAGDLSQFGKINKATPMTFGPSSVFAGKKDVKGRAESLTRSNSSSNMFSMLTSEIAVDAAPAKTSRPPSRKTSVDLGQSGVADAPQRKRLQLLPRSKPTEEEPAPVSADPSEEDEAEEAGMSEADAKKKIDEDSKEFFSVRNLEEAEVYFTNLTFEHRFRLVDKLVTSAIESKEADAQLVADLFSRAVSKDLCSMATLEEGFLPTAEILDDIAIDAPKAFNLMAIMMKGAGLDKDDERKTRIAAKSMDNDKLVALLS